MKAGLVFVCSPFGGREGDKKKIPPERSDIRQFTPVFFLQLSRIARQGLSLCTAKIVFFPEVSLSVVDLVVYLCQNCAAGGMGASPHTRSTRKFRGKCFLTCYM